MMDSMRSGGHWAHRTVGKSEIVAAVAARVGCAKGLAAEILEAALNEVALQLARGKRIELRRFGRWDVAQRAARVARNPRQPSQRVVIPARRVPIFRAGRQLIEVVQRGLEEAA